MQLKQFKDMDQVEFQANKVIGRILDDKSNINPQKISLMIADYQKKQVRLDAFLSKAVKSQIQAINQSKQSVSQANKKMQQANQATENIKNIWDQNHQFNQVMEDVISLGLFQSNLAKVIEQLTYFIDMDSEMQKLQKMAEDQTKYVTVSQKLQNLIALRDAIIQDSAWQREASLMSKQFLKVDNFQTFFYDKIYEPFNDVLSVVKEKQKAGSLSIAIKVVESADKTLQSRGKSKMYRDKAVQMIKNNIDERFYQKLQDQDDLIGVIQHSKFALTDIVDVRDYLQSIFPKDLQITNLFIECYQKNIQKYIIPFFDQIQEEQQHGNLVALLGWIDNYEMMLGRAGVDNTSLVALKAKAKSIMPLFIEHNQKLVQDAIENCLADDQKNYNRKFYEEIIRDGGDLVSFFPSDIFHFINQQAELIKDQLKGQVFIQFVRCITSTLNSYQSHLAGQIIQQFQTVKMLENQDRIVDYQYKVILFINNFNQCLKHAGESKELFSEIVSEDYKPRIQKIFRQEVQSDFNKSIPKFIKIVVQIIYLNLIRQSYPMLFTPKWLSDNSRTIMNNILKTVASELNDIQSQGLILNIIHHRNLIKEVMEFLVNAYFQQFILTVRSLYKMTGGFTPTYVDQAYTQKMLAQQGIDFKGIFTSKVAISQAIKKDKHVFNKVAQAFAQSINKKHMTNYTTKFVLLGQMLMKKKGDFEATQPKVMQIFGQQSTYLFEAVLIVRQQLENRNYQTGRSIY